MCVPLLVCVLIPHHGAMVWSAICDCDIFCYYSLAFGFKGSLSPNKDIINMALRNRAASARGRSSAWCLSLFVMCKAWHQRSERPMVLASLNSPLFSH